MSEIKPPGDGLERGSPRRAAACRAALDPPICALGRDATAAGWDDVEILLTILGASVERMLDWMGQDETEKTIAQVLAFVRRLEPRSAERMH